MKIETVTMASNEELRVLIEEIKNSMVTKEKFDELIVHINEKDAKINELEGRIKYMENQNALLERKLDDLESYGRRKNLRIIGIPPPPTGTRETAEQVTEKVKEVIAGMEVPNLDVDMAIDRAHRVGKKSTNETTGEVYQPVIVRFISWRARTAVYRKREKRGRMRIYTDLTKRRLDLRKAAEGMVRDNEKVKYAFSDVNNNIGLRLEDDSIKFFNSVTELERILESL